MLTTERSSVKLSKEQEAALAAFKKQLAEIDLTSINGNVEKENPRFAAKKREVLVWIDHCKKRTFTQYFLDKWRNDNQRNRLELLHYCPKRGRICLILDFRKYSEMLDESINAPSLRFRDGCCNCGMPAECFQSFLPRDEYIKQYGQGSLRDDSEEHKKVV